MHSTQLQISLHNQTDLQDLLASYLSGVCIGIKTSVGRLHRYRREQL